MTEDNFFRGAHVSKTGSPDAPYRIRTLKGVWHLVRNQHQPEMLCVASTTSAPEFRGVSWFREDNDGNLHPMS